MRKDGSDAECLLSRLPRSMIRHLLLLVYFAPVAIASDTWPRVSFSEVRACAWPATISTSNVIRPDKSLAPHVLNGHGTVLAPQQIARLRAAVSGKHPAHPRFYCWSPHNAFVFYDVRHRPVAFIEICFECLNYRIEPQNQSPTADILQFAKLFSELRLPLGKYADFDAFKKHWGDANKP